MPDDPTTFGTTSDDDVVADSRAADDASMGAPSDEQPTADSIPRAAVAALVAAIASGIAWGFLTLQFDSEWGFFALGVGFLVGLAVLWGTGQRKGRSLQVVAVVGSLLGIAFGKYMIPVLAARDDLR